MRNYFKTCRKTFHFDDRNIESAKAAYSEAMMHACGCRDAVCVWKPFPASGPWTGLDIIGISKRGDPPKIGDFALNPFEYDEAAEKHSDRCASIDNEWTEATHQPSI